MRDGKVEVLQPLNLRKEAAGNRKAQFSPNNRLAADERLLSIRRTNNTVKVLPKTPSPKAPWLPICGTRKSLEEISKAGNA